MPYLDRSDEGRALNIFFSYASEDEKIADALARRFRVAFVEGIQITMMSEFPNGLNWRHLIEEHVAQTDILIALATGRLKPSHSFTGFEIGSFSFSLRAAPYMKRFPSQLRRMIPFAVLARVPDTTNEFEGIDIDPESFRDVRFDPTTLADNLSNLYGEGGSRSPDEMIYKLFCDIEDIIASVRGSTQQIEQRAQILRGHARALCRELFENMLNREKSVSLPTSNKLVIRVDPRSDVDGKYDLIEQATLRLEGPCYDAFGLSDVHQPLTWAEFTRNVDEDIAFAWRGALGSLISAAPRANFIDNNFILSFDRTKIFRIFTARIAVYYNNAAEFEVYAIEILHNRDYGDPTTTCLLKAMQVSLGYRFMFLEETSEFSPTIVKATNLKDLKGRVLDLLNGLNLLLQTADEYRLNEPKTILDILGVQASSTLDDSYKTWEREKNALYSGAKVVLRLKDITTTDKDAFVNTLKSFCENTVDMNRNYTAAVLNLLQRRIGDRAQLDKFVPVTSREQRRERGRPTRVA